MEMRRRYNIIDKNTLKRGVAKLKVYLDEQKSQQPKRSRRSVVSRAGQSLAKVWTEMTLPVSKNP
jgi:hypothetical protein